MPDRDRASHEIWELLDSTGGHLACGYDLDEVIEQAADGRAGQLTEHQRGCPHCQAALTEFGRLWEPLRRLAAEPVAVPAGMRAAVARQIGKLGSDPWYTLRFTDGGTLRIAARVVAKIARDAARGVPGVKVAFGRSTQGNMAEPAGKATLRHRHPHAAIGVLGNTAVIDLAISVQYDHRLDDVAIEVRRRAIAQLRAKADLHDVTVNVIVDDIVT